MEVASTHTELLDPSMTVALPVMVVGPESTGNPEPIGGSRATAIDCEFKVTETDIIWMSVFTELKKNI